MGTKKRRNKMKRAIVLIVMIFAFLVVNLNAQPFHGKGDMGRKGNPFFMMEKLNLTDAQKDQIKDMHFANEKAEIEIEANLKLARLEMKEAMTADNIDKNRVLSLHDKINNLSGQIKEGKLKI